MADNKLKVEVPQLIKRDYVSTSIEELSNKGTSSAARQAARLKFGVIKTAKKPGVKARETMSADGKIRGALIKKFAGYAANPANYAMQSKQAEKNFADFVKANGAEYAFGIDQKGLANRQKSAAAGFTKTGGRGQFSPFIVSSGILRGGYTGKMEDVGNRSSIPITIGDRTLVSCRGKYSNPLSFPTSRVVKFFRGSWGNAKTLHNYERLI